MQVLVLTKKQRAMVVAYAYKPSTQKLRKKDCPHKLMDYLTSNSNSKILPQNKKINGQKLIINVASSS